jgi:hypothetical protein
MFPIRRVNELRGRPLNRKTRQVSQSVGFGTLIMSVSFGSNPVTPDGVDTVSFHTPRSFLCTKPVFETKITRAVALLAMKFALSTPETEFVYPVKIIDRFCSDVFWRKTSMASAKTPSMPTRTRLAFISFHIFGDEPAARRYFDRSISHNARFGLSLNLRLFPGCRRTLSG